MKYSGEAATELQEALNSIEKGAYDEAGDLIDYVYVTDCPECGEIEHKEGAKACEHGYATAMETLYGDQQNEIRELIKDGY